jgi:formate-dependent nitrite reductase membrane component NrfD
MAELSWGFILAAYLFMGGLAGGAYMVAALIDFFGKPKYKVLSKSGTYVSFLSILVGLVLLVFDLGRFEVNPLGALNAYMNFPTSIMSVGTWIITAFTIVSLLTSIIWYFQGSNLLRKILEVIGFVLGVSTTAYTGLLLAFSRGRPFWASPFLPWTFTISGSLTGLVMAILMILVISLLMPGFSQDFKDLVDDRSLFSELLIDSHRYIIILILVELGLVILEIGLGHLGLIISFGSMSISFFGYLILGLLIPVGIAYYIQKVGLLENESMLLSASILSFLFILIGGLLLRYVILTAGQLII